MWYGTFFVERGADDEDLCDRARRSHSLGQWFPTFYTGEPVKIKRMFTDRHLNVIMDIYQIPEVAKYQTNSIISKAYRYKAQRSFQPVKAQRKMRNLFFYF